MRERDRERARKCARVSVRQYLRRVCVCVCGVCGVCGVCILHRVRTAGRTNVHACNSKPRHTCMPVPCYTNSVDVDLCTYSDRYVLV